MKKRGNKNRRAKLAVSTQTVKRGIPRLAVAFLAMAMTALFGLWWWKLKPADIFLAANPTTGRSDSEFHRLKGRWQRPDGGYVIDIKNVAQDGSMDAGYFNPRSVRVAKADASRDGDELKVFVELRDVNYPGSTYTLTHDPASDRLKGIYYQAAEKQRFSVAFVRMK